ncbi:MAG: hypothetical protein QXH59_08180 [Candidatus Caldarchaeum sp.]
MGEEKYEKEKRFTTTITGDRMVYEEIKQLTKSATLSEAVNKLALLYKPEMVKTVMHNANSLILLRKIFVLKPDLYGKLSKALENFLGQVVESLEEYDRALDTTETVGEYLIALLTGVSTKREEEKG